MNAIYLMSSYRGDHLRYNLEIICRMRLVDYLMSTLLYSIYIHWPFNIQIRNLFNYEIYYFARLKYFIKYYYIH